MRLAPSFLAGSSTSTGASTTLQRLKERSQSVLRFSTASGTRSKSRFASLLPGSPERVCLRLCGLYLNCELVRGQNVTAGRLVKCSFSVAVSTLMLTFWFISPCCRWGDDPESFLKLAKGETGGPTLEAGL